MRIVGLLHHTFCHLVVQTQVQDGVHHTRHRSTGTRTYRDKQRILLVAELRVHQTLDVLHGCHHVVVQQFHDLLLSYLIVLVTAISSNCETWRNGNTNQVHLSKVSPLTTKFLTHFCISFGLTVAEKIDSFCTHKSVKLFY